MLTLAAGMLATSLASAAETPSSEAPAQADRIEVGQQAPGFKLAASDGTAEHTLDELRDEKNLVLIFLRGSW